MKGMNIIAYFESEDGEKISYDVPLIADAKVMLRKIEAFLKKFTSSREVSDAG